MSDAKKIREELKLYIEKSGWPRLKHSQLSYNYWCLTGRIADKAGILGFIDALAVFIKQEQAKAKGIKNAEDEQYKEADLSWAKNYPIQVHSSITT